jgi:hypothetical protein
LNEMQSSRHILRLLAIAVVVLGAVSEQASSIGAPGSTVPLSVLAGGETCATAVPITTLPFNDAGDTTTSSNEMLFLGTTCSGGGIGTRPGRDHIYQFNVFAGNSLTFQVTPDAIYDTAIYILGTCGNGSTCTQHADTGIEGQTETIGPVTLAPGTHYLYIDSVYSEDEKGGFGPYILSVTGTLGTPNNTSFYTVTPCRVLDTRDSAGPDGPALSAGVPRTFAVAGRCLIPSGAKSISANVTVTQPTAGGHLTVYPGGTSQPGTSTLNYSLRQTRANNALVPLGAGGTISAVSGQPPGNTVHFILDVNGYFQ